MKKIIIIIFIMLSSCASYKGSNEFISPEENIIQYIQEFPGKTKDVLFLNTNSWYVEAFNSAKAVMEFGDKEQG